ncbi:MAG: cysteine desulfurase [Candidatus Obscuribacter sp.]|jgi:cysteine desulfurase|nr:cysteine desulfurase [Candidatus Obscuribacter sp.]MBK9772413.1 cysteine desulfurase [Candidatus Obscuribacter sp.]
MRDLVSDIPIYFDYHSTTPVDRRVADVVSKCMLEDFGNASSSQHKFGYDANQKVEAARKSISTLIGASRAKVVFTSGATEALNIVLQNFALKNGSSTKKIAVSTVEHSAVLNTVQLLSRHGQLEVRYLPVDSQGRLDMGTLENTVKDGVDLVCVMAANNEIGNIYPIAQVSKICASYNTPILCDASQAAGRTHVEFDDWDLTYLVLSAHKMYGPKGIGALVCKRDCLPKPITFGGEHEYGVRPGTLNVPAIAGFGEACRIRLNEMTHDENTISLKRNQLLNGLKARIESISVNGDQANHLAGNLHISIPGVPNDALVARLRNTLALSTGSACASGVEGPSHVLQAMRLSQELMDSAIRIGIGKFNSDEEIERAIDLIAINVEAIRKLNDREISKNLSKV